MLIGKVIELDNGVNYYIVEEMEVKNRKFILAKMVDLQTDKVKDDDLVIKELINTADGVITANIDEAKEAEAITKLLLEKAHMEL